MDEAVHACLGGLPVAGCVMPSFSSRSLFDVGVYHEMFMRGLGACRRGNGCNPRIAGLPGFGCYSLMDLPVKQVALNEQRL